MNSTMYNVTCGNNGGVTLNAGMDDRDIYNCGRLEGAANGAGNLTGPTTAKNGAAVLSVHKLVLWLLVLVSLTSGETLI